MIPYPYNMVDMGGIDLAEANGTVVEGLYAKIVEAVNACGDVVLYNWKFAGIEISPQHTSILLGDPIIINGAVQVTEQDLVTVPGINPDPPVLVGLTATENGDYLPSDYDAAGFNLVSVNVPPPILRHLDVASNGTYYPPDGVAGFSSVTVSVEGGSELEVLFRSQTNEGVPYSEVQLTEDATGYEAIGIICNVIIQGAWYYLYVEGIPVVDSTVRFSVNTGQVYVNFYLATERTLGIFNVSGTWKFVSVFGIIKKGE